MKHLLQQLVGLLDGKKFVEFHTLLTTKLDKFEMEQTRFNDKITKYAAINNKQLNKQLKQFVIANNNNKKRLVELKRKKIL